MNLSPRWVDVLADAGIEAAHWSTLGAYNAQDSEIMAYASANNYMVLTHDLDFGAILAATHGEKPSVVQIRAEDISPDVIGWSLSIRTARACAYYLCSLGNEDMNRPDFFCEDYREFGDALGNMVKEAKLLAL
ncbi:DUF5615 family PIN-like protein [Xylella fastidiosa subsp. multiplex]|uniref:DUF5615 family PIN-like protein n=1 Tax=Xylella fastidiosa TaxID=2371 RepID=UPI00235F72CB|nr:DUF5615 family PIN-like protein [Xylella fastidiosa]MDD0928102.1 DUF5615 family PIN-like protein [Xylella fastidiosa subsp. multiplex]